MTNARPSNRQLQAFYAGLQAAQNDAAKLPSLRELAARRDAYLASLRWFLIKPQISQFPKMTNIQAINLLEELTYCEIREQLELAGIDGLSELDNQQIYSLAMECLTDY